MPLFDYECECGHRGEYLAAIADRDKIVVVCSKCDKRMKRVITAVNLGKPKHQTKAILADGSKVAGDWGKGK